MEGKNDPSQTGSGATILDNEKTDGKGAIFTMKNVATSIFLLLANCTIIPGIWKFLYFNIVDMSTLVFQLKVPLAGADTSTFNTLFLWMFFGGFGALALEWLFIIILKRLYQKKHKEDDPNGEPYIVRHRVLFSALLMIAALSAIIIWMRVPQYIVRQCTNSTFYEERYVDPKKAVITAPEKKRNLICIYIESMEVSYTDKAHGGISQSDMIPELTELAKEGITFSAKDSKRLNGAEPIAGTNYTMGSLIAQTS